MEGSDPARPGGSRPRLTRSAVPAFPATVTSRTPQQKVLLLYFSPDANNEVISILELRCNLLLVKM